jgi:hypothetical protein
MLPLSNERRLCNAQRHLRSSAKETGRTLFRGAALFLLTKHLAPNSEEQAGLTERERPLLCLARRGGSLAGRAAPPAASGLATRDRL